VTTCGIAHDLVTAIYAVSVKAWVALARRTVIGDEAGRVGVTLRLTLWLYGSARKSVSFEAFITLACRRNANFIFTGFGARCVLIACITARISDAVRLHTCAGIRQ